MFCKIPLNPRREDIASSLRLKIFIAPDMICIGVCVVDCLKPPAVRVQNLAYLPPRLLVVSAVDEANIVSAKLDEPNLCWALDIVTAFATCCSSYMCFSYLSLHHFVIC